MSLSIFLAQTPEEREARGKELRELYDTKIEWHVYQWPEGPETSCKGRHGVVRNVYRKDAPKIAEMLTYFFGDRCYWIVKKGGGAIFEFEFVHMTKTSPPPRKPWEWCGTSVLFEDWHLREVEDREAARTFKPGDNVWFTARGARKEGYIASVNRRSISVTVPSEGTWRVPAVELHLVK